jgi:hypothetical protein
MPAAGWPSSTGGVAAGIGVPATGVAAGEGSAVGGIVGTAVATDVGAAVGVALAALPWPGATVFAGAGGTTVVE